MRLSHSGFEVDDKFMLVAPSNEIERAVLAPAISFAGAAKNAGYHGPVFRLGFAYVVGR